MSDAATLIGDLTRLRTELASHKAQRAKLKDKGAKAKLGEADNVIAETQAMYDTIAAQLPPDVVKQADVYMDQVQEAEAALEAVKAGIHELVPPPPGITVAGADGAAHDVTVEVEES